VNCKAVIYDADLSNGKNILATTTFTSRLISFSLQHILFWLGIQEIYACGGLKDLKLYCMESSRPESECKEYEPIPQSVNLSAELKEASSDPAKCKENIDKYDPLVYIFTSGRNTY